MECHDGAPGLARVGCSATYWVHPIYALNNRNRDMGGVTVNRLQKNKVLYMLFLSCGSERKTYYIILYYNYVYCR